MLVKILTFLRLHLFFVRQFLLSRNTPVPHLPQHGLHLPHLPLPFPIVLLSFGGIQRCLVGHLQDVYGKHQKNINQLNGLYSSPLFSG